LNNEITYSVATNFNAKVDAIGKAVEEIDDQVADLYDIKLEAFTENNIELVSGTWSGSAIVGGNFDGYFSYDIDLSGNDDDKKIDSTDFAEVWAVTSTKGDYDDAGFSQENETSADTLTVYALIKPLVSIFINYRIDRSVQ
jgi:hypothetical protein